ncbi:hypothetical protein CFE70_004885 [Pyrenophora teres f. teres 0-1]
MPWRRRLQAEDDGEDDAYRVVALQQATGIFRHAITHQQEEALANPRGNGYIRHGDAAQESQVGVGLLVVSAVSLARSLPGTMAGC